MVAVVLAAALPASAEAPDDTDAAAVVMPPIPPGPPPPVALPPPATADADTILLSGDGQDLDADCAGRNVMIEGSDGRFLLRGGCRSVTVVGHGDTIAAELAPGARIAIAGERVVLRYTQPEPGPAPIVSITGRSSAAAAQ